ncbi:MAG: aldo/keto reductase [Ignisphaera sp.]|nr:aldo/keto reductase [Ignisphaera sp.]MDW8086142.1 aldo/keto reductase [Ignisphaera sp.]
MAIARDVKCFKNIGCVSSIGMGTWGIGGGFWEPDYRFDREWIEVLRRGLELGLNLIDTAEMYGGGHSEEIVGRAVKGFKRDEIVVSTKVWQTNASYESVLKSAKRSMERLGTYIDVYLLHWPTESVPICETVKAFEELVDDGIIRVFGLSNFDVEGIEKARECCRKYDVAVVQNRFSLIHRNDERAVIPYAQREGLMYMAYTPIEKGVLTRDAYLAEVGRRYGKTATQVALNWLISIENVVPIPKTSNPTHLEENFGALGWRLSREDWESISIEFLKRIYRI